jgi:hypothetical protein
MGFLKISYLWATKRVIKDGVIGNVQHFLLLPIANLKFYFAKEAKMKGYVKICKRNRLMSFGNSQIDMVQLFTDDWAQNNTLKRGNKMYEKYRENKEKEEKCLEQLKSAICHSYK